MLHLSLNWPFLTEICFFFAFSASTMMRIFGGDAETIRTILLEERIPEGWTSSNKARFGLTMGSFNPTVLRVLLGLDPSWKKVKYQSWGGGRSLTRVRRLTAHHCFRSRDALSICNDNHDMLPIHYTMFWKNAWMPLANALGTNVDPLFQKPCAKTKKDVKG